MQNTRLYVNGRLIVTDDRKTCLALAKELQKAGIDAKIFPTTKLIGEK